MLMRPRRRRCCAWGNSQHPRGHSCTTGHEGSRRRRGVPGPEGRGDDDFIRQRHRHVRASGSHVVVEAARVRRPGGRNRDQLHCEAGSHACDTRDQEQPKVVHRPRRSLSSSMAAMTADLKSSLSTCHTEPSRFAYSSTRYRSPSGRISANCSWSIIKSATKVSRSGGLDSPTSIAPWRLTVGTPQRRGSSQRCRTRSLGRPGRSPR